MINRRSCTSQESCGLPPRSVARRQRLAIDQPIKGQATFGNIVTTVYSALLRESQTKGVQSRFTKMGRGKFDLAGQG
jgi:hypothetical protein